jgi:UDP-N-acetyl-D-mannosaminuronic acid dehydrogenase
MIKSLVVMGLGYIGLPTAAMFASAGVRVLGVDVNPRIIDTINEGKIHIVEPGLEEVVNASVSKGLLSASDKPETADAYIIAVPTPFENVDHDIPNPDLKFIKSAANALAPVLKSGDLIILESTSPVGATHIMTELLADLRMDLKFPLNEKGLFDVNIAYCPERVLPGAILSELKNNSRVIGGMTDACAERAQSLYKVFVENECFLTNTKTAEMVKLTENACRDVQIAFANELSMICDEVDIDVWELIELANKHPRINILQPGPGVGGHCIAVDPWFIISALPNTAQLMHTARRINDRKPQWVVQKVQSAISDLVHNSGKLIDEITIACYGLTFKANIDDLRESPSLDITKSLSINHPGKVIAVEPNILELDIPNVELVNLSNAIDLADIHVILVEHNEFLNLQINNGIVIDTKGILR